ncbi:type III secretion system HrpP C-terminal domain-containing protein [Pseudomonas cucumis]|uniref:Type III secretion system HrpP C-terminal domain-containing protein n=1 Tax=Pseudomonas cucumis TaxID=2954082 RepID=A0ABY9EQ90_9PSED|nr:type III secretion system HrpP C-terminal domain-containing protein [Pseudomonas cucumis]WLG82433.1 type III secretion system HrpP C-terminal domain-containing protein [Pseudomonas cucumis]
MNHAHASTKTANTRPQETPGRNEFPRTAHPSEPVSEIRHDGEVFETLISPDLGWFSPALGGFTGEGSSQGFAGSTPSFEPESGAATYSAPLWDALTQHIDEQPPLADDLPIEAVFELPNLGEVAVQVMRQGNVMDIALRFAQGDAWTRCRENQESSRRLLSQRLGRRVKLSFELKDR